MPRSRNAQVAVDLYLSLLRNHGWGIPDLWKGIAQLLLTCEVWRDGWQPFHDVVVYRETNDFKQGKKGPSAAIRRADDLSTYLAMELGVDRGDLCQTLGQYWRHPEIVRLQPHNLVGHAFRSITVEVLQRFGAVGLEYEEEVNPTLLFPGYTFPTRSEEPKIDIVVRSRGLVVAMISSRWRFRHDRVDVPDEAMAYVPAARRNHPSCRFYASVGEFTPNRLDKILSHCPPAAANPAISATVHFAPQLLINGLRENGRTAHLKSLAWLINETHSWVVP